MSNQATPDEIDELLAGLQRTRRRFALYYLRDRDVVSIDELATTVTGWLAVRSGDGTAGRREYDQVKLWLYHRDLPKLDEAGLVSFDADAGTVTPELSEVADRLLTFLLEQEPVPSRSDLDGPPQEGH